MITKNVLQSLHSGDIKAYEKIFFAYYQNVKYFVTEIVRSEEDAEEISQDIFVKIWFNRENIDVDRNIGTYIYTIARNSAIDHLRKSQVKSEHTINTTVYDVEDVSPEDLYYAKEIQLLIDLSLEQMPPQRRLIYKLNKIDGKSNDEISESLNISKRSVENQLSLAMSDIRKKISSFLSILF